jgi:UDP-glucose 4-epimerase
MKKALITGGAGFIGSNLCEFLLKKKYIVNVIDNLSSGNKSNLPKKVNFFLGDINDKKVLYKSSKNCSVIFHLAAKSVLQESLINPYELVRTNILGTSNVIERSINNKSKIIFASSCAVYPLNLKKKLRETDIINAETPYGQSKIACENLINFYISAKKIKGSNLRFFNVYGPNQNSKSIYSAVIPKFIKRAKENKFLELNNYGLQSRDFIHVNDACIALFQAANSKKLGTFNIGTGKSIKIKDLALLVIDIIKKGKIKKKKGLKFDTIYSCANIDKTKRILNFKSKVQLKEGIKELVI